MTANDTQSFSSTPERRNVPKTARTFYQPDGSWTAKRVDMSDIEQPRAYMPWAHLTKKGFVIMKKECVKHIGRRQASANAEESNRRSK
jgi:hypothetical protein